MKGKWLPHELEVLPRVSIEGAIRIAQLLDRTPQSVCRKANAMNIPVLQYKPPCDHPWRRPLTKRGHELEAARMQT